MKEGRWTLGSREMLASARGAPWSERNGGRIAPVSAFEASLKPLAAPFARCPQSCSSMIFASE
jgi:hypothetical protein